jgi:transposase InsO family protein
MRSSIFPSPPSGGCVGIDIEPIKPGRPQQNGRHQRMHLTLKKETERPPGSKSLQQQARFDEFVTEFNTGHTRRST